MSEKAEHSTERQPRPPTVTGAVYEDRVDVQIENADLCRDIAVTPIGDITVTERTLNAPVGSALLSAGVAAAVFVTPDIMFGRCTNDRCGIDNGDAFDRWRLYSYGAIAGIVAAHVTWAVLASHDSRDAEIVDSKKTIGRWEPCAGKLPADSPEVQFAVQHSDGHVSVLGSAPISSRGKATLALKNVRSPFDSNPDGNLVVTFGSVSADLDCGKWGACVRAQKCGDFRRAVTRMRNRGPNKFAAWINGTTNGSSPVAARLKLADLIEEVESVSKAAAETAADCREDERAAALDEWQQVLQTLRPQGGLSPSQLQALAGDLRKYSVSAGADPFGARARSWYENLDTLVGRGITNGEALCSKFAGDLERLRNGGKWREIVGELAKDESEYRPNTARACESTLAGERLAALRVWALRSGCDKTHAREWCQAACDASVESACRYVQRLDAEALRSQQLEEAAVARRDAAEQRRQQAEERRQAAERARIGARNLGRLAAEADLLSAALGGRAEKRRWSQYSCTACEVKWGKICDRAERSRSRTIADEQACTNYKACVAACH